MLSGMLLDVCMTIGPADLSGTLSLSLSLPGTGMATAPEQSPAVLVVLTEQDIPGAFLDVHRLETNTISALRWWLLCCGICPATSLKKAQLILK